MSPHTQLPYLNKVRFICIMVRRIYDAQVGKQPLDDKDYYGNKRIEQAASMISVLFEDLFKTLNSEIQRRADNELPKLKSKEDYTGLDLLKRTVSESGKITSGLKYAMKSGNWKIQRFRIDRSGVSQLLSTASTAWG